MELLYLRVFNVESIDFSDQDINFNGQDLFKWNGEKITYSKKEEYITNLYPNNIKITGIVGKNGTGKSTLLRFIEYLLGVSNGYDIIPYNSQFLFWDWIAVFRDTGNLVKFESRNGESNNDLSKRIYSDFNYNFSTITSYKTNANIVGRSTSIFYTPHLSFTYENKESFDFINISTDFLWNTDTSKVKNGDKDYFKLCEINRQIKFIEFAETQQIEDINFYQPFRRSEIDIYLNDSKRYFNSKSSHVKQSEIELYNEIMEFDPTNGSVANPDIAKAFFYKKIIDILYLNFDYIKKQNSDGSKDMFNEISTTKYFITKCEELFKNTNSYNIPKLQDIIKYFNRHSEQIKYSHHSNKLTTDLNTAKILISIEEEFKSLLSTQTPLIFELSWEGMSTGELAFLNLFSRLHYGITKYEEEYDIEYKNNTICFLIDEPSVGFHPQWEKEMIQNILKFLSARIPNLKKHLIIATHSPFILSDIQKDDVIFLGNDKHKSIPETFGANIHELLANSFFLENGFIGEFAKNKIEQLVNYLKSKNKRSLKYDLDKDSSYKLIEIIGEPIIQTLLHDLWTKKFSN